MNFSFLIIDRQLVELVFCYGAWMIPYERQQKCAMWTGDAVKDAVVPMTYFLELRSS